MGSIGERERLRGIVKRFFGGFLSLFLFFSFYSGLIFFSLKFFLHFFFPEKISKDEGDGPHYWVQLQARGESLVVVH